MQNHNHTDVAVSRDGANSLHPTWGRKMALVGVFLLAFALRLIHLDEAPRDFWTVRQYYVPMLAQALFLQELPDLPLWQQELVQAHKQAFQSRELPVMEWAGVAVFRIIGRFAIWPLRIQPVLAWVLGGIFLFLIARSLFSFRAGVIGVAFYLFLPYGVTASRSLQPDSLMVMALLAAIWSMVRYHERPSGWRWGTCVVVSGLAILVKPGISQFAISATYLALAVERMGWRRAFRDPKTYLFYAGAALPAAGYLWARSVAGAGLSFYLAWNFKPELLSTLYFWKGWLGILLRIFGLPALALAGWGFAAPPSRRAFSLMLGFGLGYLAQCFFTIVATPTHDYWHLQVVPLVALGVGGGVNRILSFLDRPPKAAIKKAVAWSLACLWAVISIGTVLADAYRPKNTAYFQIAKEIGEAVGHSTRTIILDHDKGYPLMYLANIHGRDWPVTAAMQFGQVAGTASGYEQASLSAADRYARFYAGNSADFFIVCRALDELDRQPGLRDFLYSNFRLMASGYRYLIFDLRERRPL